MHLKIAILRLQLHLPGAKGYKGTPGPSGREAQLDCGPAAEIGATKKSEASGPKNGVSRCRGPNLDIYSRNDHFGLVYDTTYQFLGMEAKNYLSLVYFANNIHPWPRVMPIFDREMPPRFTPAIC